MGNDIFTMNDPIKKNKLFFPILILVSVMMSVLINAAVFCVQKYVVGEQLRLYPSEKNSMELVSYSADENGYFTVTGEDPQLIFKNVNSNIGHIELDLGEAAVQDIRVQLYYMTSHSVFTEECSFVEILPAGETGLAFELDGIKCSALRFDIDGNFRLKEIGAERSVSLNVSDMLLTELVFLLIIAVYGIWRKLPEKADKLSLGELIFWLLCSGYYFVWSCTKPYNYAPDEYMRYPVSKFIFENNRLPVGAETADNPWGFSYSQMPTMLCNFLGYIPMKIVSLFTNDEYALVVASRFGCVICGAVCLLFLIKISKLMIKKPFHWVMIVFVALMPQFCFLCSYINNDICALCGAAMIMYAWVRIIKEGWHTSLSVIMAAGIGICGISYYNSYGWVLMSVFMLLSYFIINKADRKRLFKQGLIIAGITLAIMAFPFIRQYVVFGDLLGFKATSEYGELYAIESLKPSVRRAMTIQAQGIPLWDMLWGMGWLRLVYKSFIGVFGYMAYPVHPFITRGYFLLLCGMAGIMVYIIIKGIKSISRDNIVKEYRYIIFYVCLLGSMAIPVVLSIVYSYTNDYQAQGRYIYSMMPGLALIFGISYSVLFGKIRNIKVQNAVTAVMCGAMAVFNSAAFFGTYLPS